VDGIHYVYGYCGSRGGQYLRSAGGTWGAGVTGPASSVTAGARGTRAVDVGGPRCDSATSCNLLQSLGGASASGTGGAAVTTRGEGCGGGRALSGTAGARGVKSTGIRRGTMAKHAPKPGKRAVGLSRGFEGTDQSLADLESWAIGSEISKAACGKVTTTKHESI
jgi:hypothetical protein